jgi:methyltransferase (TIGR00027 family)
MAPAINSVPDTAFLVAACRVRESERARPLFRDPLARKLAREYYRPAHKGGLSVDLGWYVVIRTIVIDDLIKQAISQGVDTVLNLGAGLDARPYRMQLPETLRWVEVDFPAVIDVKNEHLAEERPNCRLERFAFDLTNRALRRKLFDDVSRGASKLLVITECVIPYLTEADVAELADDLRSLEKTCDWIVDCLPYQLLLHDRAPKPLFQFRPSDWFGFFNAHGWRVKETSYLSEAAKRLGRPFPRSTLQRITRAFKTMFCPAPQDNRAKGAAYVVLTPS